MVTFVRSRCRRADRSRARDRVPQRRSCLLLEHPEMPATRIAAPATATVSPRFTCSPLPDCCGPRVEDRLGSMRVNRARYRARRNCFVFVNWPTLSKSFWVGCVNGKVVPVDHKPPTAVIESAHREHALPFHDTTDFDNADRGFIAALSPCVIKAADGRVVWDNDAYSFLDGPAPTSVHPSLWRQSTLAAKQGLYEVVPGIYQVRGFDLSNITFVEGDTGVIVIDPLVSTEVAAAALALVSHPPRWRPARRRGDLHPQPRRPFRRRAGRHLAGGRGCRAGGGPGAGRLHRARGPGERLRRPGDDAQGDLHVRHRCWSADPGARWVAGSGRRRRPARWPSSSRPSTSARRVRHTPSTAWRSNSRWRRAPRRPPKCTSTSRASARCAWPRTPLTICTTC